MTRTLPPPIRPNRAEINERPKVEQISNLVLTFLNPESILNSKGKINKQFFLEDVDAVKKELSNLITGYPKSFGKIKDEDLDEVLGTLIIKMDGEGYFKKNTVSSGVEAYDPKEDPKLVERMDEILGKQFDSSSTRKKTVETFLTYLLIQTEGLDDVNANTQNGKAIRALINTTLLGKFSGSEAEERKIDERQLDIFRHILNIKLNPVSSPTARLRQVDEEEGNLERVSRKSEGEAKKIKEKERKENMTGADIAKEIVDVISPALDKYIADRGGFESIINTEGETEALLRHVLLDTNLTALKEVETLDFNEPVEVVLSGKYGVKIKGKDEEKEYHKYLKGGLAPKNKKELIEAMVIAKIEGYISAKEQARTESRKLVRSIRQGFAGAINGGLNVTTLGLMQNKLDRLTAGLEGRESYDARVQLARLRLLERQANKIPTFTIYNPLTWKQNLSYGLNRWHTNEDNLSPFERAQKRAVYATVASVGFLGATMAAGGSLSVAGVTLTKSSFLKLGTFSFLQSAAPAVAKYFSTVGKEYAKGKWDDSKKITRLEASKKAFAPVVWEIVMATFMGMSIGQIFSTIPRIGLRIGEHMLASGPKKTSSLMLDTLINQILTTSANAQTVTSETDKSPSIWDVIKGELPELPTIPGFSSNEFSDAEITQKLNDLRDGKIGLLSIKPEDIPKFGKRINELPIDFFRLMGSADFEKLSAEQFSAIKNGNLNAIPSRLFANFPVDKLGALRLNYAEAETLLKEKLGKNYFVNASPEKIKALENLIANVMYDGTSKLSQRPELTASMVKDYTGLEYKDGKIVTPEIAGRPSGIVEPVRRVAPTPVDLNKVPGTSGVNVITEGMTNTQIAELSVEKLQTLTESDLNSLQRNGVPTFYGDMEGKTKAVLTAVKNSRKFSDYSASGGLISKVLEANIPSWGREAATLKILKEVGIERNSDGVTYDPVRISKSVLPPIKASPAPNVEPSTKGLSSPPDVSPVGRPTSAPLAAEPTPAVSSPSFDIKVPSSWVDEGNKFRGGLENDTVKVEAVQSAARTSGTSSFDDLSSDNLKKIFLESDGRTFRPGKFNLPTAQTQQIIELLERKLGSSNFNVNRNPVAVGAPIQPPAPPVSSQDTNRPAGPATPDPVPAGPRGVVAPVTAAPSGRLNLSLNPDVMRGSTADGLYVKLKGSDLGGRNGLSLGQQRTYGTGQISVDFRGDVQQPVFNFEGKNGVVDSSQQVVHGLLESLKHFTLVNPGIRVPFLTPEDADIIKTSFPKLNPIQKVQFLENIESQLLGRAAAAGRGGNQNFLNAFKDFFQVRDANKMGLKFQIPNGKPFNMNSGAWLLRNIDLREALASARRK